MTHTNSDGAPKPATVILRPSVAATRTGYSTGHLRRLALAGDFPAPVKIGPACTGFIESEVEEWLASRIAASRANREDSTARSRTGSPWVGSS